MPTTKGMKTKNIPRYHRANRFAKKNIPMQPISAMKLWNIRSYFLAESIYEK